MRQSLGYLTFESFIRALSFDGVLALPPGAPALALW